MLLLVLRQPSADGLQAPQNKGLKAAMLAGALCTEGSTHIKVVQSYGRHS